MFRELLVLALALIGSVSTAEEISIDEREILKTGTKYLDRILDSRIILMEIPNIADPTKQAAKIKDVGKLLDESCKLKSKCTKILPKVEAFCTRVKTQLAKLETANKNEIQKLAKDTEKMFTDYLNGLPELSLTLCAGELGSVITKAIQKVNGVVGGVVGAVGGVVGLDFAGILTKLREILGGRLEVAVDDLLKAVSSVIAMAEGLLSGGEKVLGSVFNIFGGGKEGDKGILGGLGGLGGILGLLTGGKNGGEGMLGSLLGQGGALGGLLGPKGLVGSLLGPDGIVGLILRTLLGSLGGLTGLVGGAGGIAGNALGGVNGLISQLLGGQGQFPGYPGSYGYPYPPFFPICPQSYDPCGC